MQAQPAGKVTKVRRNRIPLSCEACRARKLKCNREKPCQNCTARGEACNYKGSANGAPPLAARDRHGETMRQRIDHLEDIVKKLINQPLALPSPDDSQGSVASTTSGSGRLGTTVVDGTHSVYKPTDDWHDVLREINELKEVWNEAQNDIDDTPSLSNTVDGTSLLFSQVERVDLPTILSSLPPKPEVDRLIQWFFDRSSFPISVPPIVHEQTFLREYENHWKDPSQTGIIWLGLLFSILGLTMLGVQFGGLAFEGTTEKQFHLYRLRTAQCLLMGDIAKCLPYTVETLRFNATAELNRKDDNSRGLWIMTGVIVRVAVNMGYHRDPDHISSVSALKAEYRRRVWLSVLSMDEVASFLSGFPRMTPAINSDTKEPRNLHEWEITEDSSVLPPSRPLSEPTPATYLIAKGRVFHALGEVVDFVNGPHPDNYDKAMEIDRFLWETWKGVPEHMRLDGDQLYDRQPTSPADHSNLQLACMYHYGICLLHRKFIHISADNSRGRIIASSLALIDYQRFLQPSWYAFSRIRQMLAPAAMTILLELETRRRIPDIESVFGTDALHFELRKAVDLWRKASSSCPEATKLYNLLRKMLRSYEVPGGVDSPPLSSLHPDNGQGLHDSGIFDVSDKDINWAWWDEIIAGSSLWE
ncbi:Zn(II)2Cys6 transcription factor [Aspergillus undulatus]|uniref:Zn(II)2Cys6 transcription factor n=1 Tax=Aspergillus undulatus TaxID=1810928 RepID=UPI003CCD48C5